MELQSIFCLYSQHSFLTTFSDVLIKESGEHFTPICLKCNKSWNVQLVLTNTKHFSNFLLCFQLENYIEDRMLNGVNG